MYAIIEDSGTQIKVRPGDILTLDLRELKGDQHTLVLDRVLVIGDAAGESAARIGLPYIDGATVTASVFGEEFGDKLVTWKYKRRKGSRKKIGHRQGGLRVKIDAISG